jgi:hypothetical protein
MAMKKKNFVIVIIVTVVTVTLLITYRWQDNIRLGLTYGWDNLPTHASLETCTWERKTFQQSGISFYLQTCKTKNPLSWTYSEDSGGKIVRTNDLSSRFTMEAFTKQQSQSPLDIVTEQFAKLTSEQQKTCQIQSADEPIEYLPNGTQSSFESPHLTPHKTRYEIGVKPEIAQRIVDKYDGLPSDQQCDYLCGKVVGSQFRSSTPYLEFDDRSPGKYLLVGSLGNDGSVLIDLNSIRF